MQHGASFFLEGLAVRRLVLVSCIQFRACARCLASQKISSIENSISNKPPQSNDTDDHQNKKTFLDHFFPSFFDRFRLVRQHRSHKVEKRHQNKSIRIVIRQETESHSNGRYRTRGPAPSLFVRLYPGIKDNGRRTHCKRVAVDIGI